MNPNADYLGIVTMLRSLREQGLVSGSEAKKIAARLRVQPVSYTHLDVYKRQHASLRPIPDKARRSKYI